MLKLLTWIVGTVMAVGTVIGIILEPRVLIGVAGVLLIAALVDGSFRKEPDDRKMPGPR